MVPRVVWSARVTGHRHLQEHYPSPWPPWSYHDSVVNLKKPDDLKIYAAYIVPMIEPLNFCWARWKSRSVCFTSLQERFLYTKYRVNFRSVSFTKEELPSDAPPEMLWYLGIFLLRMARCGPLTSKKMVLSSFFVEPLSAAQSQSKERTKTHIGKVTIQWWNK